MSIGLWIFFYDFILIFFFPWSNKLEHTICVSALCFHAVFQCFISAVSVSLMFYDHVFHSKLGDNGCSQ